MFKYVVFMPHIVAPEGSLPTPRRASITSTHVSSLRARNKIIFLGCFARNVLRWVKFQRDFNRSWLNLRYYQYAEKMQRALNKPTSLYIHRCSATVVFPYFSLFVFSRKSQSFSCDSHREKNNVICVNNARCNRSIGENLRRFGDVFSCEKRVTDTKVGKHYQTLRVCKSTAINHDHWSVKLEILGELLGAWIAESMESPPILRRTESLSRGIWVNNGAVTHWALWQHLIAWCMNHVTEARR